MVGKDCQFEWVPTEVVPPCCVHPGAGRLPLAVRITGPTESVVVSSLRTGIFLTVKQIQSIIGAFKIPEPAPGSGSGKNGRVVKMDLSRALIGGLFHAASGDEKAFMIASLMVRKKVRLEDAPDLLVKLTSMLDTSEAQHFGRERKAALDELAVNKMKANIARTKGKEAEEEEEGPNPSSGSGIKRSHEEAHGAPMASSSKAKKGDEAEERSMKLRKNNVRAPKQFISFFPLVSQTYFKWQPQLSRVGAEFADKERFLDSALHPYFYFPTFFFHSLLSVSKSLCIDPMRLRKGSKNKNTEVVCT